MLAFTMGGIANAALGWRMTFVVLGAPGLLLCVVVLWTMREPRRGASEGECADATPCDLSTTVTYLWSLRSLRWLVAGASLNLFAASASVVWSASFLIRVHHMTSGEAGAWLGMTLGVGGIAGTVCGGLVAQRLSRVDPAWMLRVPAVTSALALPFAVSFLTLPSWIAPVLNLGASFFGTGMLGPLWAVTQMLALVRMRAQAAALVALVFNLVGAGLGPFAVVLSDRLAGVFGPSSIRYALLAAAVVALPGAALSFQRGARHVASELERAHA
jgi:predicted MFS family arabinose efflux permease